MSRWFRFYEESLNDPKVQRLSGDTFKAWVNLLCLASKDEDGVLPCLSDMAFALRLSEDQASDLLNHLYQLQLLDEVELPDAPMSYTPHNWKGRQYKSDVTDPTAPKRQKAYRERNANRNGDRNATVTNTATRADTEQKQISSPVATATRTKAAYSEEFEQKFWQPYPRSPTMSKSEAWKAWGKLTPEQREASCRAIEPYRQFLRLKPNLETVHACRFLSQQRYEGFTTHAGDLKSQHIGSFI